MHFWLRLINYQTYHIWVFIKWTRFLIKSTKIGVFYQYGYIDITKNRGPWLAARWTLVTSNLLTNIYFGFHLPRVVMFLLTVLWDPSSPLFGSTIHQVGHFSSQQNFLPKHLLIQKILCNGLFTGPSKFLTILALFYLFVVHLSDW